MTYAPLLEAPHPKQRPPKNPEDYALAQAIIAGDQRSLHDAYDLYATFVNGVAIGILKDPHLAADITQEVFVRLWQRGERFDPERGTLKSYLQIDAHGRAIDLLRSRKASDRRERLDHEKTASTHTAGTEELAMTAITSTTVRTAMMGLPEDQRNPIAMAFFGGHSYRDVAKALNVPEGTVKSRIRLGMKRLQLALGTDVL
jgi:RNA polymerase sigma-70 factor (ECF subfamily)